MRTLRTAALTAAALAAGAAMTGCGNFSVGTVTRDNVYDVTQRVTGLAVKGSGSVTVTGSDSPGIRVVERLRWSNDNNKPRTTHAVNGDTLNLTAKCGRQVIGVNRCAVAYEIRVPRKAAVNIDGDTGDIRVSGVTGALKLRTDTGDIRVPDLDADRFDASTDTGDIRVGGRAETVVLSTDTGDVELSLTAPPASVQAAADTGGVRLRLPKGTGYAITATVDTGSKRIDPALRQDSGSRHRVKASAQTGDVVVEAA